MGRGGAKGRERASLPPDHWTHTDPDRELWTPSQRAQAQQVPSRAVWEAMYGIGQIEKKQRPRSEREFIKALRRGEINPSRGEVISHLRGWIEEDRQRWSEHFEGRGPVDHMISESGSVSNLASKMYEDFLEKARNERLPPDAAGVLALAMCYSKSRDVLASALQEKAAFCEDDSYLFDKILPALYASPELEDFMVSSRNIEGLIKNIVSTPSVKEKHGEQAGHAVDINLLIGHGNPTLANNVTSTLRDWDWPRQIGEESGDIGYVNFIQIAEGVPTESQALKESAIEACQKGLSYLVALRLCAAVACTRASGQEKLSSCLSKRSHLYPEDILNMASEDKLSRDKVLGSLFDTMLFSAEQEDRIREAWEACAKADDHTDPEDFLSDSREKVFLGIRDAASEYVRHFPNVHPTIQLPEIITEAISQRLRS